MGKGRVTVLDVLALVREWRTLLVGMRLANVYSLYGGNRFFLFKFSEADAKRRLIVESGARAHITQYDMDTDQRPNNFAVKLRQHCKAKRLESVRTDGLDRVVDLQFGSQDHGAHHVIVELYGAGNIVLTDEHYKVLSLLRPYNVQRSVSLADAAAMARANDDQVALQRALREQERAKKSKINVAIRVSVGVPYPVQTNEDDVALVRKGIDLPTLRAALRSAIDLDEDDDHDEEHRPTGQQNHDDAKSVISIASSTATTATSSNATTGDGKPRKLNKTQLRKQRAREERRIAKMQKVMKRVQKKRKKKVLVRSALGQLTKLGAELTIHSLLQAGLPSSAQVTKELIDDTAQLARLMECLRASGRVLLGFLDEKQLHENSEQTYIKAGDGAAAATTSGNREDDTLKLSHAFTSVFVEGGASTKRKNREKEEEDASVLSKQAIDNEVIKEFMPCLLAQHDQSLPGAYHASSCRFDRYATLNEAMDEFFSKVAIQKEESKLISEKRQAINRVERVREHHESSVLSLNAAADDLFRRAESLRVHAKAVDAVIASINGELEKGVDWEMLVADIELERGNNNPIAALIVRLDLAKSAVTVRLPDVVGQGNENGAAAGAHNSSDGAVAGQMQGGPRILNIVVDLKKNAHLNAAHYFEKRKHAHVKAERTLDSSASALRAAEKRAEKTIQDVDLKSTIQKLRHVHWFEKFHWFVTSENYLVIGGKDAQQNEIVVKRYMGKNDVYLHSDAHGASSVVIKNPTGGPISPLSLEEAGSMTVCRSAAWNNKVISTAYWVYPEQVSKTAPTGMSISTGSFVIRGKRNFIPRKPLEMGVGILFRVGESCVEKHAGERFVRRLGAVEDDLYRAPKDDIVASTHQELADNDAAHDMEDALADCDVTTALVRQLSEGAAGDCKKQGITVNDGSESGRLVGRAGPRLTMHEKRQRKKAKGRSGLNGNETADAKEHDLMRGEGRIKAKGGKDVGESPTKKPSSNSDGGSGPPLSKEKKRRAKAKLARQKYKEQDEADRALASKLYGVRFEGEGKANGDKHCEKSNVSAGVGDVGENMTSAAKKLVQDASVARCFLCRESGHLFGDCPKYEKGLSFSQAKKKALEMEAAEAGLVVKEEGGDDFILQKKKSAGGADGALADSSLSEAQADLAALTGMPYDDDILLYAVPVVAPFAALALYKYRIKLVPGSGKKGKSTKAAVTHFMAHPAATKQEKDLIKSIPETEFQTVLLSHVRLAIGSASGKKKGKGKNRRRR